MITGSVSNMCVTRVMNLKYSNSAGVYSLPPEKAVVAAYEQNEKRNFNTRDYPKPENHPEFVRGEKSVACGDYCALTCYKHFELAFGGLENGWEKFYVRYDGIIVGAATVGVDYKTYRVHVTLHGIGLVNELKAVGDKDYIVNLFASGDFDRFWMIERGECPDCYHPMIEGYCQECGKAHAANKDYQGWWGKVRNYKRAALGL